MKKAILAVAAASAAPSLSGCVPMMAVSAVSSVAQAAQGRPVSNEGLKPQAREACSAQAAQHGTVHVIDVEQNRVNRIIVWGTVENAGRRRSFECHFSTKVDAFKLRVIGGGS